MDIEISLYIYQDYSSSWINQQYPIYGLTFGSYKTKKHTCDRDQLHYQLLSELFKGNILVNVLFRS